MPPRPNEITAMVGARGTGKTPVAAGEPGLNIPGIVNAYLKKGMPVIILDTEDHPKWRHATTLKPGDNLRNLKVGLYRIVATAEQMLIVLQILDKQLWNACVIGEDAYRYIPAKLDLATMALLSNSKNKNVDSFWMFHAWGLIPKDMFRLPIDNYEVFYSAEHPSIRKAELSGCYDKILAAWERCQAEYAKGNKYHHETVKIAA